MLDDFLIRALLAGLGTAAAAAPLGCFVVWRRMAYFGDAVAHASLLGIALALALSLSVTLGALMTALLMALAATGFRRERVAVDTRLGVMAHASLAIGMVTISLIPGIRIDVTALFFGDILAVTRSDLAVVWAGAAIVLATLVWRWSALLISTLDPDLAASSGIDARAETRLFTIALAITVAVAIKIVGALLIASLMIIPAAAARPWAATPERMALLSLAAGAASVCAGLAASLYADTPAGPSIVCAAAAAYLASTAAAALRR